MTAPPTIPFLRVTLDPPEHWVPFLEVSYREARFSNFGPLYRRLCLALEHRYAVDGYTVVLASSATSALTAVLLGLGISGPVVVPAFTFPATLHAVMAAGCEPVLCDVDPESWEISLDSLNTILARRMVAAVMPVRSFGLVRDLTPLMELADRHGLSVVADAAASLGAKGREAAIGSAFGHVEVMSLHATKVFRIGEGGAVFLPRGHRAAVERAMNFGLGVTADFGDGTNAKVDELRCAVGLAALARIDDVVSRRERVAASYQAVFTAFGDLATVAHDPGPTPWQTYPVQFASPQVLVAVETALRDAGIETRRYYAPSLSDGYIGARLVDRRTPCPTSEALAQRMLCFPIFESMTDAEEARLFTELPAALSASRAMRST